MVSPRTPNRVRTTMSPMTPNTPGSRMKPRSPTLSTTRKSALPAIVENVRETMTSSGVRVNQTDRIQMEELRRLCPPSVLRMTERVEDERRKVGVVAEDKGKGKKRMVREDTAEDVHEVAAERRSPRKKRRTTHGTVDCGVQTESAAGPSTLPPSPPKTPARKQAIKREDTVLIDEVSVKQEDVIEDPPSIKREQTVIIDQDALQREQIIAQARRAAAEAAQHEQAVRTASVAARAIARTQTLRRQASLDQAVHEQTLLEREARVARAEAARAAEAANAAHLMAVAEKKMKEAKAAEKRVQEEAERMRIEEEERRKASEARRVAEEMAHSLAEKARKRAEELLAQAAEIEARLRAAEEARARAEEEARARAEEEARWRELEARLVAFVQEAESRLGQRREVFKVQCAELETTLVSVEVQDERVAVLAQLRVVYDQYLAHFEGYKEEMANIAKECASLGARHFLEYVNDKACTRLEWEAEFRAAFEGAWNVAASVPMAERCRPMREASLLDIPMREASRADIPMRDASGFMDRSMASVTEDTRYADDSDSEDGSDFEIPHDSFSSDDAEMDSGCATPRASSSPLPPSDPTPPAPAPPPPAPALPTSLADFFQEWETAWDAVMRSNKNVPLPQMHFSSLPWPVLDAANACAVPVYVQAAEDITRARVECFVAAYAAHYGLPTGAMRKKVAGWLTACHSDKSDRQVVDRIHETHRDAAKEMFQACTCLLVDVKRVL